MRTSKSSETERSGARDRRVQPAGAGEPAEPKMRFRPDSRPMSQERADVAPPEPVERFKVPPDRLCLKGNTGGVRAIGPGTDAMCTVFA